MKEMDFIANGEIVEVIRVRRTYEMYGFRFADVLVRFQDYDLELETKILWIRCKVKRLPFPAK